MNHFECHLNRRFWRSKKVVQVVQFGGQFGQNPKNISFFQETFPNNGYFDNN